MARIKYYYDTETCKYERLRVSSWDIILNTLGFIFLTFIFAAGLLWGYLSYFESPKEAYQTKEIEELVLYYEILNKELEEANQMLASLEQRDNNIYRVIFEAEPIPRSIENTAGGLNKYRDLLQKNLDHEKTILNIINKIEKLKKGMYVQTKSYDEIINLAKHKTEMLACIPAIQPVSNKELTKLASGFGMRIHPIYKVKNTSDLQSKNDAHGC
jgi:hypothetical protein